MLRYSFAVLVAVCALAGPPKGPASGTGSGAGGVTITATLHMSRDAMKAAIGEDPGEGVVVIEVTMKPAAGKKLTILRDGFLLRSDRDGQRSQPLYPTQLAGNTVMVVRSVGGQQGTSMQDPNGPVIGGIPGTGGRPSRLPGTGGGSGSATADTSSASASIENTGKKDSALLKAVRAKILPEKSTEEPVSGLLYFPLDGKHKPKHLELLYKIGDERISVRFKEPK